MTCISKFEIKHQIEGCRTVEHVSIQGLSKCQIDGCVSIKSMIVQALNGRLYKHRIDDFAIGFFNFLTF